MKVALAAFAVVFVLFVLYVGAGTSTSGGGGGDIRPTTIPAPTVPPEDE